MAISSSAGARSLPVHAFVLCWPGKEENAHAIAKALKGCVDRLTVTYKSEGDETLSGPGEWVRVPSEWYYGRQFQKCLSLHSDGIMLQIQADAVHDDWPGLVSRCRAAFRTFPQLGVWSPNVHFSWYSPRITEICRMGSDDHAAVMVTDGVVWAIAPPILDRLKTLDYRLSNIGWGLTEAAAAFANSSNLLVVMDLSLKVYHPKGSGYDRTEALRQCHAFLDQLSPTEHVYLFTARRMFKYRQRFRKLRWLRRSYWRPLMLRLLRPRLLVHETGPGDLKLARLSPPVAEPGRS